MAKFANTKGLSKQEKFIIKGMLVDDETTEDIAKYLDREVDLVESYIVDLADKSEPSENVKKPRSVDDFMIKKTQSGKDGVVVMTETASQRSENKKVKVADRSSYIHKIK